MPMKTAEKGDRQIPNDSKHDVVSFELLIDGKSATQVREILSVDVTHEANRIPTARIVVRDGEASTETFEASESADFVPGKLAQISAGRDGINKAIFKGVIVRQSLKARQGGDSTLTVECKHKAVKLTVGRKNKYYQDVKDSDVISQLLAGAGLTADVDATVETHKEVVQFYAADWDFLMHRADMNGLLVLAENDKVRVKKPDTSPNPVLNLIYGSNLLEFETEMDARHQWESVETSSWDFAGQNLIHADSSSSAMFREHGSISGNALAKVIGLSKYDLRHSGHISAAELKAWADATMLRSRMAKIRGRAKFLGYADVHPGDCVMLQGLGATFNGKAYVTAVRHEIGGGTWFTHAQFGLSPEFFFERPGVQTPPASGLAPAVSGLHIGVVVQIEKDPDAQDRILVKMPLLDNEARGIWARVASLDAGAQRGSFFRPEIGDEVIVGFVNDDPRHAVVLGMLHSAAKPAPLSAKDDNPQKGFITRSQMKLLFDDEKKIIRIETPGGNKVVISDEDKSMTTTDQNGNEIKTSPDGVSLKSPKDIKITATGDITIEGMNVNVKAQMNFSAKGQIGATVESSATTTIKGGMVMIN